MSGLPYKCCAVPSCTSTTIKNPDKLFIHVPKAIKLRKKWLNLARRDPKKTSNKSTIYFCEDHFHLPDDMENYTEYRIMGSVKQVRLKPNCLPSKFLCQPDRLKRTAPSKPRAVIAKRQRMTLIQEAEMALEETNIASIQEAKNTLEESDIATTSTMRNKDVDSTAGSHSTTNQLDNVKFENKSIQTHPELQNKIVQASFNYKYRSKAVQTYIKSRNTATSPIATHSKSIATSPFEASTVNPSRSGRTKRKLTFTPTVAQDTSPSLSLQLKMTSDASQTSSPSINSLQLKTTSDSEQEIQYKKDFEAEIYEIRKKRENEDICTALLQNTMRLFKTKPRYYIGIPKESYYLVKLIEEHIKIPEEHILLCLTKIRLNAPFSQLGDQFGISLSYACKIFKNNIPLIAKILRHFIIKSNKTAIKENLPTAFRHKYHNVYCIIDCLEIEIQKPTKSVDQALSWSEYKKTNTIKYLISSTPDGIINYISPGYSGRISDVLLIEKCTFLYSLPPGACILADRGFKHIDQLLQQRGFKLLRPPSVSSGSKLTKIEARRTKEIASLRIHIERVIRRLREFSLLKPHSVVKAGILQHLDECVEIACGLINLQDSLIKNK